MSQIGNGNNIPLRLQVRSCENIDAVVLDGPQHERFEDTLPKETARTACEDTFRRWRLIKALPPS
jgi:hypothetical protein